MREADRQEGEKQKVLAPLGEAVFASLGSRGEGCG